MIRTLVLVSIAASILCTCNAPPTDEKGRLGSEDLVMTAEAQDELTPDEIVELFKLGNQRFLNDEWHDRDFIYEQQQTSAGQHPAAIVLSCIDSRAPAEILFDAGIGDIFNARVAGNVVNEDVLGSMEYSCHVAGAKVILVLGHTSCGAVKGAIDRVELGNLTGLLAKIELAVAAVEDASGDERSSTDQTFVDAVALENVRSSINRIRETSPVLKGLEDAGEIRIVGAMYDVSTGAVAFLE